MPRRMPQHRVDVEFYEGIFLCHADNEFVEPLPGQTNDQSLQLLGGECDGLSCLRTRPREATPMQPSGAQPQTIAIMHEHLDPIGPLVREQIRVVRTRLTEHLHHTRERRIRSRSHVERLDR